MDSADLPAGTTHGADTLFATVYGELRTIAARLLRGDKDPSAGATALVSAAYLALCERDPERPYDRQHFLRTAARVMRHLLIDQKRSRATREKHVVADPTALDRILDRYEAKVGDLLQVGEALQRIGRVDPDSVRLIDLHFFAGLSLAECAPVLGISVSTAQRWWHLARARLARELLP